MSFQLLSSAKDILKNCFYPNKKSNTESTKTLFFLSSKSSFVFHRIKKTISLDDMRASKCKKKYIYQYGSLCMEETAMQNMLKKVPSSK